LRARITRTRTRTATIHNRRRKWFDASGAEVLLATTTNDTLARFDPPPLRRGSLARGLLTQAVRPTQRCVAELHLSLQQLTSEE
jgi:hypothetical protein